jgi:hypothetical protein
LSLIGLFFTSETKQSFGTPQRHLRSVSENLPEDVDSMAQKAPSRPISSNIEIKKLDSFTCLNNYLQ